jgi:hypothetical protein
MIEENFDQTSYWDPCRKVFLELSRNKSYFSKLVASKKRDRNWIGVGEL